ncbi:MAG TPA: tetratricopeptide repeat protein [Planctomycetaceae bacterium]|jgi:tetratricopeptide (TPR) repeat protein|nr:tetratricopeptide repeat protein [Planctomycetaceae bacterium]
MTATTEFDSFCEEGRRHVRHQDADAAIASFTKALALDDRAISVHEGLAAAYFLKKDYPQAAEHFKKVTLLDPRQAKALVNLGAVYNRMSEFNKAVTILRKAVSKDKSSGEGHYNLGLAYRGLNQQAMAVSAYKEAVRVAPQMAAAHQNLANVYVDMGNFQHAIIHYLKALEINPEFERARRGLESAQELSTQAKNAVSPFGRLVDKNAIGAKSAPRAVRHMNDAERAEDRMTAYNVLSQVDDAANLLLKQVREAFEPALLTLGRTLSERIDGPSTISRDYRTYITAFKQIYESRRALKRSVAALRAHEEMMNTPDAPVR